MYYGPEAAVYDNLLSSRSDYLKSLREVLIAIQTKVETKFGPFMRGLTAVVVLIYLMSLVFSFDELFGATSQDELIKLTEKEIIAIKKGIGDFRQI